VLLLDTNALLAVLSRPGRLGKKTEGLLNSTVDIFYLPISVFEIAIKHMVGKIRLNLPLSELLRELNFGSLPFRVEDALETYSLPSLAWLEPLPPRMILKSSPRMDSPGVGSRSANATRSIEMPPTTKTPPGIFSLVTN
jgi:PIN domain nuclease of toxin-antitoxin system